MNNSSPLFGSAWSIFKNDRRAFAGLIFVLILFVIAVLAPFLADNKPILLHDAAGWSMPLLHSLTADDWRYFFYGFGLLFLVFFAKQWKFRNQFDFVFTLILLVETFCFVHQPILNSRDYKTESASFKWMPLVPYSPFEQTADQFAVPSSKHWCGTDSLSRDVASRMFHGARTSLTVGFVAEGVALLIGTIFGALAGYYRKGWDLFLSRLIEVMECFPTFFLILTVIAFLPPSLFNIMMVIGLTSWTGIARLVRGEFLRLSMQPFTLAALASGAKDFRVIARHILPNAMGPLLVTATFGIASAILVESSLSFLGFGVPPPAPSWGDILSESRHYIDFAWWLATFPGIAIFITITAYNLVGEGFRDAIDPRLRV